MPKELMLLTAGTLKSKAILFIFFDLLRPDTFYQNDNEQASVEWLLGEVNTYNKNPDIIIFLVGINADKQTTFNKLDAHKFADTNKMTYVEVNCNDTADCNRVMKEAILQVCDNMKSNKF